MKGENISGTSVELVKIRLKKGARKTRSDNWSTRVQEQVDMLDTNVRRLDASWWVMREEIRDLTSGMYLLVELNQRLMGDLCQLRVSQVHSRNNPIVIDGPEDDVLDTTLVHVPPPVQHQLVLIDELNESVEDSEEGERRESLESSEDEEEVWEIPWEEFEATARSSSPEL